MKKNLLQKITTKKATIGIIGLGYVGLPLAIRFADVGFKVIGFEKDESKNKILKSGKSYIRHIDKLKIKNLNISGFLSTSDYKKISRVDIIIICLPTPLNAHKEPDLSYITNFLEEAIPYIKKGQLMSLESTTYPGTTEELLFPKIEAKGLKIGKNYFLVYSPEREDPGNMNFTTKTMPKICGGVTSDCKEVGKNLYQMIIDKVVPVSSTRAAELVKLLENIHRAVNIGLVNEMKMVADKMNIDIYEVIEAAATKPFGFVPYFPGPGLGGHCIPIDPFYLTWKAKEYDIYTKFIELAGEINSSMPNFVISKTIEALNTKKIAVNGSKLLLLGVAYKKNIDDSRESPAYELIEKLSLLGANINYSDPYIPKIKCKIKGKPEILKSLIITSSLIKKYDAILLITDHDVVNYQEVLKNSKLIIDCRGRFSAKNRKVIRG